MNPTTMKMIFHLLLPLIAFTFTGCTSGVQDITTLEGYWEIERVDTPEKETRTYKVNTAVDHYLLETDSTGYKIRVSPQFDGSFLTTGDREAFTVRRMDNETKLYFSTPFGNHTETISLLKEQQLILVNEAGIRYTYKRFQKFDLK